MHNAVKMLPAQVVTEKCRLANLSKRESAYLVMHYLNKRNKLNEKEITATCSQRLNLGELWPVPGGCDSAAHALTIPPQPENAPEYRVIEYMKVVHIKQIS